MDNLFKEASVSVFGGSGGAVQSGVWQPHQFTAELRLAQPGGCPVMYEGDPKRTGVYLWRIVYLLLHG